jgi:sRNA-binding regulator protein Hfq
MRVKRTGTNSQGGQGRAFCDALEMYRKEHGLDSFFIRECGSGAAWCFFLHDRKKLTGTIIRNEKFECDVADPQGSEQRIHKVCVKFACPAAVVEEVERQLKLDEAVAARKEGPHFLPKYRHPIEDGVLFDLMNRREVLFFTMLEGEVLRGIVRGFSKYEIQLGMKGEVPVVLLRHGVYDVRDKRGRSYRQKRQVQPATGAKTEAAGKAGASPAAKSPAGRSDQK